MLSISQINFLFLELKYRQNNMLLSNEETCTNGILKERKVKIVEYPNN